MRDIVCEPTYTNVLTFYKCWFFPPAVCKIDNHMHSDNVFDHTTANNFQVHHVTPGQRN